MEHQRSILHRSVAVQETPFGKVRLKTSSGWQIQRQKWEYNDLVNIARLKKMTLPQLLELLEQFQKRYARCGNCTSLSLFT